MANGNLVVGQSGGPTAVINCSLLGVVEEALKQPSIGSVLGLVNGIEGAIEENLLDLDRQPASILEGLCRTPASALGSCRRKLSPADYERILEVFRAHDIRYFLYIGGNDSMDTCLQMESLARAEGYDLRVIGIPKTIDNDLPHTDHCPGYGSVARWVAQSVMDIGKDLLSMRTFMSVYVLEVMGRNAGWIAAAAGLANRPNDPLPLVICLPEQPFNRAQFLEQVSQRHREFGCALVVTSEALRSAGGQLVADEAAATVVDAFGHKVVYGAGDFLARMIQGELGLKCRSERPGTVQRAATACVSPVDQAEAREAGRAAVRLALADRSGLMVTLERLSSEPYRCTTGAVPLQDVASRERLLPSEFMAPFGVTSAFLSYAAPLIGGPLPDFVTLEPALVPKRCRPQQKLGIGGEK
jgi:6-phosphofructokinase